MRTGDVWLGAGLLLAGLAVLVEARGFPTMAGLPYGPGLFPSIAAVGLMACGALVALGGWRGGAGSGSRGEPGTSLGRGIGEGADDPGSPATGEGGARPAPDGTAGADPAGAGPTPGGHGAPAGDGPPAFRTALRVAVVPLAVVFFGLALDGLGFHVTAAAALLALFMAFGLGPLRSAAFALAAALAIHAVFYSLLRVPLPWGVLTPIAW